MSSVNGGDSKSKGPWVPAERDEVLVITLDDNDKYSIKAGVISREPTGTAGLWQVDCYGRVRGKVRKTATEFVVLEQIRPKG